MYEWFINLLLRHPRVMIICTLLVTAALASQLPHLYSETDVESFIPARDDARENLDLLEKLFGTSYITRIMIMREDQPDGIYNPGTLEVIAKITEWLQEQPEFETSLNADLRSLSTTNNILGDQSGMVVVPFMEEAPASKAGALALRKAVEATPMYRDMLVARDGKGASILVRESKVGRRDRPSAYHHLRSYLDSLRKTGRPETFLITGRPIIEGLFGIYIAEEGQRMLPYVMAMLVLFLALTFRTLRGVLLPVLVVACTEVWMFGFLALWGHPVYTVTSVLPILIVSIAVADSIHLLAKYYQAQLAHLSSARSGCEPREGDRESIVRETMREMGLPVFMTSLTTVIGFLSMTTSALIPLDDFGIITSVGIASAFVLTLVLIPAFLAVLPLGLPRWSRRQSDTETESLLSRLLSSTAHFSLAHSRVVLVVFLLAFTAGARGISLLETDSSMVVQFPPGHHIRRADTVANEHFNGSTTLDIIIDGGKAGALKEPALLDGIDRFQAGIEQLDGVGDSFSVVEIIKRMNRVMHADSPRAEIVPASRDLIAQYLLLYSISGDPGDLDDLVDYDYRYAHVAVFLQNSGTAVARAAVARTRELLGKLFAGAAGAASPARWKLAGRVYTNTHLEHYVNETQISSIAVALPTLVLLTGYTFGGFVMGILCVIPVSLAVLGIYGTMGWIGMPTDVGTTMLGGMALGIGVDFAIHYLHKYNSLRTEGLSHKQATEITAVTAGRALFFNAVVLIAGFIVLLDARLYPQVKLGGLIGATMLICYCSTIYLFPAVLGHLEPRARRRRP